MGEALFLIFKNPMFKRLSGKFNLTDKKASLLVVLVFSFLAIGQVALASEITPKAIMELVNISRKTYALPQLKENSKLDQAAKDKAWDMISRNYFSHTSPTGTTSWDWFDKNEYDYKYAGENLAMSFFSVEKEHQAWMDSPTHRKNILNPTYEEIGVAVSQGIIDGHMTTVAVQMFGTRNSPGAVEKVTPSEKKEGTSESEFKKIDEGLISVRNNPVFAGVSLEKINGNLSNGNVYGTFGNGFLKVSDLSIKSSNESGKMLLGKTSEAENYGTPEMFIYLIIILIMSFATVSATGVVFKTRQKNSFSAAAVFVICAILVTAAICKIALG